MASPFNDCGIGQVTTQILGFLLCEMGLIISIILRGWLREFSELMKTVRVRYMAITREVLSKG